MGVIVIVLICPVTVSTDVTGVGTQVLDVDSEVVVAGLDVDVEDCCTNS